MMKIRALIVEDQQVEYDSLRAMLKGYDDLHVVGNFLGVQPFDNAVQAISEFKPDLIFVDHDLQEGGKNGLALCHQVLTTNMLAIFFSNKPDARYRNLKMIGAPQITKNPNFKVTGNIIPFPKNPHSIILKEDLDAHIAYAKLFFQHQRQREYKITEFTNKISWAIPVSKIIAIYTVRSRTNFYLHGIPKTILASESRKQLLERYPADEYSITQCHNEWLVHPDEVTFLSGKKGAFIFHVKVLEKEIPVGRKFENSPEVQRIINRFKQI